MSKHIITAFSAYQQRGRETIRWHLREVALGAGDMIVNQQCQV